MKRVYILLLLTVTILSYPSGHAVAQKIIPGFEAPESVIKYGEYLFVSNIGGAQPNPMALDSNGFISKLSVDGKILDRKFSKAILNGPKGLAIAKNVLYTADINRIVGFDISSGKQAFELLIPDAAMLNDLCAVDDETLVVSETVHGKIYLVHPGSKKVDYLGTIDGANGVTYDAKSKKLYACGMGTQMNGQGKFFEKDLGTSDTVFVQLQNSPVGIFDGLELKDDGHLIASDWVSASAENKNGRYVVYDLNNHTYSSYVSVTSPADLYYDRTSATIYLPQMLKNSLIIEKFSMLKAAQ